MRRNLRARRTSPSLKMDALLGGGSGGSSGDSPPVTDECGESNYLAKLFGAAGEVAEAA